METNNKFQSYEQLFGDIDFKKGKEGRSVYSPAAYLVDLLQLLEDKFGSNGSGFYDRRSEVKDIPLNGRNAFTMVPYLDIVNAILEEKIAYESQIDGGESEQRREQVYNKLKGENYPMHLPFNLENEEYKKFMGFMETQPHKLYTLFSLHPENHIIAQEFLGLSKQEYQSMVGLSMNAINLFRGRFGLEGTLGESFATVSRVSDFMELTGLTGSELRELLFQNLSGTASRRAAKDQREMDMTTIFYINHGTSGSVRLDEQEENILWSSKQDIVIDAQTNAESSDWFIRIKRADDLIRLSKKTGISLTDLDLILRSCCGNKLDAKAIQIIAITLLLHRSFELPIDEVCALASDLSVYGIGNEDEPADLFNRIFNNAYAEVDKRYLKQSAYLVELFDDPKFSRLSCDGDILESDNKDFRKRVCKALNISEKHLALVINKFRVRIDEELPRTSILDSKNGIELPALSLLFRVTKLVEILDISYSELFDLMDIIEFDPSIRKYNQFSILIDHLQDEVDCYKILENTNSIVGRKDKQSAAQNSFWLVQTLTEVVKWMQTFDFTGEELKQILTGMPMDEKEMQQWREQKLAFLNEIYQQFKPAFLNKKHFVSDQFDERTSGVIYRSLLSNGRALVSKKDERLINFEKNAARNSAYRAISRLDILEKEDFLGLGIEEKMLDKIYTNLMIKEYLNADGALVEENFPDDPDAFRINNSDVAISKALFDTIHNLYEAENGNGNGNGEPPYYGYSGNGDNNGFQEIDLTLFPSDLEDLNLEDIRRTELYDNLIFNGYINEEGTVLEPAFFSDENNVIEFQPNANIDAYSQKVYDKIRTSIHLFEKSKLTLSRDAFSDLSLKEIELDDLMENLKFNEYIDASNSILNKNKILETDIPDFNIALQFYPVRYEILDGLKAKISGFKSEFYTFPKEAFKDIADDIVADLVIGHLADSLKEGVMIEEQRSFFSDEENIPEFHIGPYFNNIYHKTVFSAVSQFIEGAEYYKFINADLDALGFGVEDIGDIMGSLNEGGYVINGNIPHEMLSYFLNVNNALNFEVEGFGDYSKDIFFSLYAIANEVEAAINECTDRLESLAQNQENILIDALAENFELPAEVMNVVMNHFYGSPRQIVEEFMLPVLESVDDLDMIPLDPVDNNFNITFRRLRQIALLTNKLGLEEKEADGVFKDQDLIEKFPEKLTLPKELSHFDVLLEATDGNIYMFKENQYWKFSSTTYELLEAKKGLAELSEKFKSLPHVDAAFVDEKENTWIISGMQYFCKVKGSEIWETKEKVLGKVDSNFDDLERIDASFRDHEGKTYLFSGEQYVRYSDDYKTVETGYPKMIEGNWKNELSFKFPEKYYKSIDASLEGGDKTTYIFKDDKFISSKNFMEEIEINGFWGKVKNNFAEGGRVDGVFADDGSIFIFSGDQLIKHSDSIEHSDVLGNEGSLMEIRSKFQKLPFEFQKGVDSAFKGFDGKIHLFKNNHYTAYNSQFKNLKQDLVEKKWGLLKNNIQATGVVNAAFAGLDGRTYIFSGNQYCRYSSEDYSKVDEGYPRTIESDWGGLKSVDAAFILDGKTYVFGRNEQGTLGYLDFATNDYSDITTDDLKEADDNWWNLPDNLVEEGFATPDAVYIGNDGNTYLFHNDRFVFYDQNHRWWSEPQQTRDKLDSIPFDHIAAAFTGKDGKTYVFEGNRHRYEGEDEYEGEEYEEDVSPRGGDTTTKNMLQFARYSDVNYSRIDDRFPKPIDKHWGQIRNNIETDKKIDASLTLLSPNVDEEGIVGEPFEYTYLFSGSQFFRYTGKNYEKVDEGYPKSIATALKNELRFTNLKLEFNNGVDAAFADQRNVYLFQDADFHVVSSELYKKYPSFPSDQLNTAYTEGGSVFLLENSTEWNRINGLENVQSVKTKQRPTLLRNLPSGFEKNIDSILNGTDMKTYVFRNKACYNVMLEKAYPISEEWGIIKNNIRIDNKIDAVFVGRDDKLYVFRGDQYVSYNADEKGEFGNFVDENPKSIKEYWGGLDNVRVAFVKGEKTYLVEEPDKHGNFRYVCYTGEDYKEPENEMPVHADFSWWEIPDSYVEEGFKSVNAVLFENDNMYLLNDDSFVGYSMEEDCWTYARPFNRIWRDIPINKTDFKGIRTAFTNLKGDTYFFGEEKYVRFSKRLKKEVGKLFTDPAEIRESWGIVKNNISQNHGVDAAFVFQNKITYLFSGDQYVRYSTSDYHFVDAGYPMKIAGNLRKEEPFNNLPEVFEEDLKRIGVADQLKGFDAILANDRNVYIFENGNLHVVSQNLSHRYDADRLGRLKNNITEVNKVDAAFCMNDMAFLLSGDQYVRYSSGDFEFVDEGFPKSIEGNLIASKDVLLPVEEEFYYDIDAALMGEDDMVYLFKGRRYHVSLAGNQLGAVNKDQLKPILRFWGKVKNNFKAKVNENVPLDAAFIAPDGKFYAFKNDQYVRYSDFDNEFVDEGYPKLINDNWGDLYTGSVNVVGSTLDFEESIDSAFVFEGKTYFVKGAEYVRYSDTSYQLMDSIYPQPFNLRWGPWNDFLLNDIKNISRFKNLQDEYAGADFMLSDFLYGGDGYKKEPYKILSELFDWNIEQVKWLKQKNVFLKSENQFEKYFNLEQVLKMHDTFSVCQKIGIEPEYLFGEVWSPRYQQNGTGRAADYLYSSMALINSEKDWKILKEQINREMNLIKRDALMEYLIWKLPGVENSRDLFSLLLIDVEMGNIAMTSTIKEAIAAVQLFLHRYFVNLEESSQNITPVERGRLKKWWKWMRNYRVWEANRKVFLYPENYIRPELRDTKSPEFKKLEDALLQGEINAINVEAAFRDYLNDFSVVGNLRIKGANVYEEDATTRLLMLFGQTRTEPFEYFYRTAKFSNDIVEWGSWEKVGIPIPAERVFPVHAFGRTIVFWIEIEETEESQGRGRTDEGGVTDVSSVNNKMRHRAHINYSYYDFNKRWCVPQKLKREIELNYEIDAIYMKGEEKYAFAGKYCLKTSPSNPTGDVKTIRETFPNFPEEYFSGIDSATVFKNKTYFFKGSTYYCPELHKNPARAHDIKGLFNITPGKQLVVINVWGRGQVKMVDIPAEPLPKDGFDAAFVIGNDIICLVDKTGQYSFYEQSGNQFTPIKDHDAIVHRFPWFLFFVQTISNKKGNFAQADAVYKEDGLYYVLRDGQYECYDFINGELKPLEGFPKSIKGNLSFNMDKFFDKLHVAWNPIKGGNINLTYTTPRDEILLFGELLPDFTFEEMRPSDSFVHRLVLGWEKVLRDTKGDHYNAAIHQNAEDLVTKSTTKLSGFLQRAQNISKWDGPLPALEKVAQSVQFIAFLQPSIDWNTVTDLVDKLKVQLETFVELTGTNVKKFREVADELIAAIEAYKNADKNKKVQLRDYLRQMAQKATNIVFEQSSRNKVNLRKLQTDFGNLNSDLDHPGFQLLTANANQHMANVVKFDHFLHNTKIYLDHFKRSGISLGSGNDNKPANQLIDNGGNAQKSKVYREKNEAAIKNYKLAKDAIGPIPNSAASFIPVLTSAKTKLDLVTPLLKYLKDNVSVLNKVKEDALNLISEPLNEFREIVFGRFDLFDPEFKIINKTNFTFGDPDWFVFDAKNGTFLVRPMEEQPRIKTSGKNLYPYEIIRLTTTNISGMGTQLFTGGVESLISLTTQQFRELPGFDGVDRNNPKAEEDNISYKKNGKIKKVPISKDLDFGGANGNYYWEIFFHIPFLIAQTLNTAQKFEDAKDWYEYIYDPTEAMIPWKFLPFTQEITGNNFLMDQNQIQRYLNDPFDPHAIAALRINAYRKAIVMNYVDNLLDWGDMLFRQYSMESINEARMLYILAYDLLGDKPESLGTKVMSGDLTYTEYKNHLINSPDLLALENELGGNIVLPSGSGRKPLGTRIQPAIDINIENVALVNVMAEVADPFAQSTNDTILNPYFFIPENSLFMDYWERVEDRLFKIRHSLNIKGIQQPLLLFQPPIDPMALVLATSSGAGFEGALADLAVAVPHYRYEFIVGKAKELLGKIGQFGNELLGTLEKKDAEELSLIQTKQEGIILNMMQNVRAAQLAEAESALGGLKESLKGASARLDYHHGTQQADLLPGETAQVALLGISIPFHVVGSILNLISGIGHLIPSIDVGPFKFGAFIKAGGGEALSGFAEASASFAEAMGVAGELAGMMAGFERMREDWEFQIMTAEQDVNQLEIQIEGAEIQVKMAQREIEILEKEMEQNESIQNFMRDKFTNKELYQWMASKLSGLYYQTFQIAYDFAKVAEKAFQFERGIKASEVHFIRPNHWNSQRRGLLAGESLELDIDRMDKAFIETDERRFEISKEFSLLEHDPLAFILLKVKGVCEFSMSEAFFDYDFQGHYCRQIKTIIVTIEAGEGQTVNATLTQLNHKTVLEADAKAVKFLLTPKDKQPLSIRSDWKTNQQVILSHVGQYKESNGMFEDQLQDDRYLPFEGTGAVSTWRLELNGKLGSYNVKDITDVKVNVKYTALQGGVAFGDAVKGMLKPYVTSRMMDLVYEFEEEWSDFLEGDSKDFIITFTRDHFPNMSSSKILSIYSSIGLSEGGQVSMILNNDEAMVIKDRKYTDTTGLSIRSRGSDLTFTVKGRKENIEKLELVFHYKAKV